MILTDREIQIAIDHDLISISPRPDETAYSSTSLDLTLDKILTIYKDPIAGVATRIDPSTPGFNHEIVLKNTTENLEISAEGFEFCPGKFLLAWTRETVELKPHSRIAARVEGKSSLARLGIAVHLTAPTIHSGFKGNIRLEMYNHNSLPIVLRTGMKICQLIFEQTVGTPVSGYKGRFAGQSTTNAG